MDALVWEAPREMAMRERPEPAPTPGEIMIRVAYAGICGSELGGYLGHNALRKSPMVMGHEFSGTITRLGKGVAGVAIGQNVTCNPLLFCGTCRFCKSGQRQLCRSRSLVGAHRPGAFANFVTVTQEAVVPLPVSLRDGAMVEPIAVGVRLGRTAGALEGETGASHRRGPDRAARDSGAAGPRRCPRLRFRYGRGAS